METVFFFSALIGGTFLLCQFALTLLGHDDMDEPADSPDHLDFDGQTDGGDANSHHSNWLFGVISFRTLVAATTFFGLSGMFMLRSGAEIRDQLLVAIASGAAALFGVHWLMNSFHKLSQNGTMKISNTIGKTGTVNLSIPGAHSGRGKVQVEFQGRLEELTAVTTHPQALAKGSRVQVTGIESGNILEVEPMHSAQSS